MEQNLKDNFNKLFDQNCVTCLIDYKNGIDTCNGLAIKTSKEYFDFIKNNYKVKSFVDKLYTIDSETLITTGYRVCKK